MHWLLIAVLLTPAGPVSYSQRFDFQYQCLSELQSLQSKYPGSTGSCSFN